MKEPLKIKKNDTRQIKKSIKQLEGKVEALPQKATESRTKRQRKCKRQRQVPERESRRMRGGNHENNIRKFPGFSWILKTILRTKKKRTWSKHIRMKFQNTGDKKRIQKSSKERNQCTYRTLGIRMTSHFSTAVLEAR